MKLRLPIALNSPIGILRQWAGELRAKEFFANEDFHFLDEDLFNFSITTASTTKASGVFFTPTLTGVDIVCSRTIPLNELRVFKFRIVVGISWATAGVGPEKDITLINCEAPFLSLVSQLSLAQSSLTGINAVYNAPSNPIPVFIYAVSSVPTAVTSTGLARFYTLTTTAADANAPRTAMQIGAHGGGLMGLVPSGEEAATMNILLDGIGLVETAP